MSAATLIDVAATPFAYPFATGGKTALVVIDMQRDFVELGNDVTLRHTTIVPISNLRAAWRGRGWPIVHTREPHKADLSDCPPVTHLVFAGVTTEVCVQTSMCEANDRGYTCLLVQDGTESYFPEFKAATLAMIAARGAIVGWHKPSATLLGAIGSA